MSEKYPLMSTTTWVASETFRLKMPEPSAPMIALFDTSFRPRKLGSLTLKGNLLRIRFDSGSCDPVPGHIFTLSTMPYLRRWQGLARPSHCPIQG